jgi:predicted kinase
VGKSTLARRWALEHPDTLLLEIDDLRTWVSGWSESFEKLGSRMRHVALAMISAYAATGYDVVLPQLVADAAQLRLFEDAATRGGADYAVVFLHAEPDDLAARLAARPADQPSSEAVHQLLAAGEEHQLERYRTSLLELASRYPQSTRLRTRSGDLDGSYKALVAAVPGALRP